MRSCRRALVLVGATVVAVMVPVGPAGASVSISTSMTVPIASAVGETNLLGSITVINSNTAPQSAESQTLTQLRLAPSCASAPVAPNPCPTPDTGVFSVAPTATGAAGTACAGVSFAVSAPDASGIVTFTPSSTVILAPPGAFGSDRCTVNFTFSVLKVPATDVNVGVAGVQTFTNARVQVMSSGGLSVANHPSAQVTVVRATPGLTTQASPSVTVGGAISDTATVTGVPNVAAPTGTVTFQVFGPNNATCAGAPAQQSTNAIAGGTTQSDAFVVTQPGVYRFVATYNGDANYGTLAAACNAPNEAVIVHPRRPPADFGGDGRTDFALFRPSNGTWYLRHSTGADQAFVWGLSSDVAVAGDYDGSGTADIAVFRPSNGTWYVRTGATVAFGTSGDVAVPGNYDGSGTTDIAVFRPSNGTWYVHGGAAVAFGTSGDVPVAGDYDGNGTTDIAVFRPSTGVWYVQGGSAVAFGTSGDIPVPGDYDGNGTTDIAVFRPSNGIWYVRNGVGTAWGGSGDIPVPGDYDGNGTTDIAVFRPSNGIWYVRNGVGTAWGGSGDVPVALPPAIRALLP